VTASGPGGSGGTRHGVDAVEANLLTERWLGMPLGSYSATRGWSPAQLDAAAARLTGRGLLSEGTLTRAGHEFRDGVEAATDHTQHRLLEAIGDELDDTVTQLAAWSQRCIAAGTFPDDPVKRAAG
jgi:hypothetical protein